MISALRVGAFPPETGIAGAFVDILAGFSIAGQLVARVTDTLEGSLHVDALPVVTLTRLAALVQVPAETSVSRVDVARLADTDVGAERVLALTSQADQRVLQALVNIHTGEAGGGEFEAGQTLAFEGAVHVGTFPVRAHPGLPTLVVINALSVVSGAVEARRTLALPGPGGVVAASSPAQSLLQHYYCAVRSELSVSHLITCRHSFVSRHLLSAVIS